MNPHIFLITIQAAIDEVILFEIKVFSSFSSEIQPKIPGQNDEKDQSTI